jgi:Polysaccharide deacetylase
MPRGALVISFDFEMAWSDRTSPAWRPGIQSLEKVRYIVDRLLETLNRYHISATWATVGHLFLRPQDCPGGRFSYDLPPPRFSWFEGNYYGGVPAFGEDGWQWFYAPDMVERIVASPTYQELGSHTFSHIDVGDQGVNEQVAQAEFELCQQLARNWGRKLNSVVFPHNFAGHLAALEATGYRCYRGLNCEWWLMGMDPNKQLRWKPVRLFLQPLRYLDERWPICPPLPPARRVGKLWEIPHSMLFQGFQGASKFISADARARRAILGLRTAAERGRLFSFWTHPESLIAGSTDDLLRAFDEVCREAAELREAGKIDVLPMEQVADRLDNGCESWTR